MQEYDIYLYGTHQNVTAPWDEGGGEMSKFIQPTISCLLENLNEYVKVSMSISQIILGLAPTILALSGASSLETSLIAVIGKRPVLAMLIAWGSPGIYIDRAFQYPCPRGILKGQDGRYHQCWDTSSTRLRRCLGRSLVGLEYIATLGAVTNVALASWGLGTMAICMVAPNFTYFPLSWVVVGITVHIAGAVSLSLRSRRVLVEDGYSDGRGIRFCSALRCLRQCVSSEFRLLGKTQNGKICVQWLDESVAFLAISWFHSLLCVAHVIFGTIIFSGMIFIGPMDAFIVFFQFLASCLLCRIVLIFELAGLREAYDDGDVPPVLEQVVGSKGAGI